MKLELVKIKNYRSIEEVIFEITKLSDGTFTYGLIGVNEAGKSSILKALALKDGLKNQKGEQLPLKKDFKDKVKPIEIEYFYILSESEVRELTEYLRTRTPSIDASSTDLTHIKFTVFFNFSTPNQQQSSCEITSIPRENTDKIAIQEQLKKLVADKSHKSVFWTAEDRYLISNPINLDQFSTNLELSIPLKNCFALAGMINLSSVKERIALIGDSTEREQLENDLGEKVTEHINAIWKKHPIKITFSISDKLINFHVHDLETTGRAKTADQRSDGFGQFVSFLLTVSAQNRNEELSNSILLIDEPETHLHPQAQEDLLREFIRITQNERNNIVFFATHSNYLIDKNDLSRNYKISKPGDKTQKDQFDKKVSTYASVTYEVFDIPSTDYHNELYGRVHEIYQDANPGEEKRSGILYFDNNFLNTEKRLPLNKPWKGTPNKATLPTYVRNCIHHPDNGNTYTDTELRESINYLQSYL